MVLIKCDWCKSDIDKFTSEIKINNFCNYDHYWKWKTTQTGNKIHNYNSRVIKCDNCGKDTKPLPLYRIKRSKHHFCDVECKNDYQKNKHKLFCDNCGSEILKKPSRLSKYNYCSSSCRKKRSFGTR